MVIFCTQLVCIGLQIYMLKLLKPKKKVELKKTNYTEEEIESELAKMMRYSEFDAINSKKR